MSNYNELIVILKELLTNRFYPKPNYIRGLLGDGQGNVIVPNRPDFNYVRPNRSSTETFEVFNKEVSQPVDGWPILLGELPWQPGLFQVVATDWSAYSQTGWGDSVASIQAHSPTHEWPNFQPGSDPLNVYLRAITPLRTQSAGTGSASVIVTSYEYDGATGTNYLWPGVPPLDLSAATPPTGSMRYMGVYLNPATNTLGVVSGSTTVFTNALEPDRPVWPRNIFPSAYVRLYGGQPMVQERDIRDARRLFDTSLMFTGTPAALPQPIVTGTFLSGQDGTPGWISYPQATATDAGIVELATQAEVDAGTDAGRVVTPATLANYHPIAHIVESGHPANPYPATPNADDAEFNNSTQVQNNTIGTHAGGDFWEWSPGAPTDYNINSTALNMLFIKKNAADSGTNRYLSGDIAAIGQDEPALFECFVSSLPKTNKTGNIFSMKLIDTSSGNYCRIQLKDDTTNGIQVIGTYEAGSGETIKASITLGHPIGPCAIGLRRAESGGSAFVYWLFGQPGNPAAQHFGLEDYFAIQSLVAKASYTPDELRLEVSNTSQLIVFVDSVRRVL